MNNPDNINGINLFVNNFYLSLNWLKNLKMRVAVSDDKSPKVIIRKVFSYHLIISNSHFILII